MRRTAYVFVLLGLLLPAAAWAGKAVLGDGTLSVRNGDGNVRLDLDRGVAVGRIGSGQIQLIDPKDTGCATPLVWDDGEQMLGIAEERTIDAETGVEVCVYRAAKGRSLRFRLLGSEARSIRLFGQNISMSAVGRGKFWIKGSNNDFESDGTWSLNGADYVSLPTTRQSFPLVGPNNPPE
jgi:hypothetical protein